MDIQKIVKMYNDEHKKLDDIAKELKCSKGAISKALKANEYVLDRTIKKYSKETTNIGNNKTTNNVSRETINNDNNKAMNIENNKTIETKNRTFELPVELIKALKLKSSFEDISMVDIVVRALKDAIEDKYFHMQ